MSLVQKIYINTWKKNMRITYLSIFVHGIFSASICQDVKQLYKDECCGFDLLTAVSCPIGCNSAQPIPQPAMIFEIEGWNISSTSVVEGPVVVDDVLYFTEFRCSLIQSSDICTNSKIWSYNLLSHETSLFRIMDRTINGLAYRDADHSLYGCIYEESGGLIRIPLEDGPTEVLIDSPQFSRWNDLVFNPNQTVLYISQFDAKHGGVWKYDIETKETTPLITSHPESDSLTYASKYSPGWYEYSSLGGKIYLNLEGQVPSVVLRNFTQGGIYSLPVTIFQESINAYVTVNLPEDLKIEPIISTNLYILEFVNGQLLNTTATFQSTATLVRPHPSAPRPVFMVNGIEISKNGLYLYFRTDVNGNDHIYRYEIETGKINPSFSKELYNVDGMFVDGNDNLYAQRFDFSGIDIINTSGDVYRHIPTPTVPFVTNIVRYRNDLFLTTLFGHVLKVPL